jgi:GTP 3',8-cyclase
MILSSIYAAAASPGLSVKINCVLMRNLNYSEILQFIEMTRDTDIDVRFIEVMPFEDNHWDPQQLVPYFEVLDYLKQQVCSLPAPLPLVLL